MPEILYGDSSNLAMFLFANPKLRLGPSTVLIDLTKILVDLRVILSISRNPLTKSRHTSNMPWITFGDALNVRPRGIEVALATKEQPADAEAQAAQLALEHSQMVHEVSERTTYIPTKRFFSSTATIQVLDDLVFLDEAPSGASLRQRSHASISLAQTLRTLGTSVPRSDTYVRLAPPPSRRQTLEP